MEKKLFYFGCIGEKGHYLFYSNSNHAYGSNAEMPETDREFLQRIDGVFPPARKYGTGIYRESIVPPLRIVAWWDCSVDPRPGSSSTLIGYGYESAEEMFEDAKIKFPSVMNRQPMPVALNKSQIK